MALLRPLDYEYTEREMVDVFGGYNHQLKIDAGEFYDMKNLSSSLYPLMSNRKKRGRVQTLTAPGGLLAKEHLAYVDDGTLYYNNEVTPVTGLAAGDKQLVSMGAYIVIFPDKKYYNTDDPTDYGSLEAVYTSTGNVKFRMCKKDGTEYDNATKSATAPEEPENGDLWIDISQTQHVLKQYSAATSEWTSIATVYTKITFISEGEVPGLFKEYDGITISGAEADVNGEKVIYGIGQDENNFDYIIVVGLLDEIVDQTTGFVKLERNTPDMDFVCECQNRLWGCKYGNNLNEIYCCALGDFKNWRQYMGLSTDSWTASVGTDGPWTGCVNYLGMPIFFKDNHMHKVGISATGAHQLTDMPCRGVQQGSSKSLVVVNETLLYKNRAGVCAYQGGFPSMISAQFGEQLFTDAVAGTVGDKYYISMTDGKQWYLLVYDVRRGLWIHEDDLHVTSFAALGDELYAISYDNGLLALNGTEGDLEPFVEWEAETGMLYYQMPDRKYVSRFNVRLFMEEGAELDIFMEYDSNGEWKRQGRIKKRGTNTVTVPIRPRRCDHCRIKIVGKGEVKLYSIAKILVYGSDVG